MKNPPKYSLGGSIALGNLAVRSRFREAAFHWHSGCKHRHTHTLLWHTRRVFLGQYSKHLDSRNSQWGVLTTRHLTRDLSLTTSGSYVNACPKSCLLKLTDTWASVSLSIQDLIRSCTSCYQMFFTWITVGWAGTMSQPCKVCAVVYL